MVKSGQIMSDWWYTYHLPLWKTWLRQLGSSKSPIHGKKTCFKPPNSIYIYTYYGAIIPNIWRMFMKSPDVHGIPQPRCWWPRSVRCTLHGKSSTLFSPASPVTSEFWRTSTDFMGLMEGSGYHVFIFWLNMKLGLLNWGYPNLIATLVIETIRMNNQHLKRGTSEPTAPHRCPNILVHLSTHWWYSPTIILDINIYIYINIYHILT